MQCTYSIYFVDKQFSFCNEGCKLTVTSPLLSLIKKLKIQVLLCAKYGGVLSELQNSATKKEVCIKGWTLINPSPFKMYGQYPDGFCAVSQTRLEIGQSENLLT